MSKFTDAKRAIRVGILPWGPPGGDREEAPRGGNFITVPGHPMWDLKTLEEVSGFCVYVLVDFLFRFVLFLEVCLAHGGSFGLRCFDNFCVCLLVLTLERACKASSPKVCFVKCGGRLRSTMCTV